MLLKTVSHNNSDVNGWNEWKCVSWSSMLEKLENGKMEKWENVAKWEFILKKVSDDNLKKFIAYIHINT